MYDYLRVYIVDNLVIYRRLRIDLIQSALVRDDANQSDA